MSRGPKPFAGKGNATGGSWPRKPKPFAGKRVRFSSKLNVVHEDPDLLVVDKPAGLLSVTPEGEERDNLFDMVKEHVRAKRGPRRVWIVHRLDKEASGLMVFAKSERAFQTLKEDLRQKRVHRLYTAVLEGEMGRQDAPTTTPTTDAATTGVLGRKLPKQLPSGTIQSFLVDEEFGLPRSLGVGEVAKAQSEARARRDAGQGGSTRGDAERVDPTEPKLAVTHWRVLAYGHGRTLVQCRLETGRKNQIRVHMAEAGHPIVGDQRFGAASDPVGRVALHASELGFDHPGTGRSVRYRSEAPPTFKMLLGGEAVTDAQAPAEAADRDAAPEGPGAPSLLDAVGGIPPGSEASPTPPASPATPAQPAAETSWDPVATWYDELIEEEKSDHFRDVIVPGTLSLLKPERGLRVLDVACGQGALVRQLLELGAEALGVDASPRLVDAARARGGAASTSRFVVGDARDLGPAALKLGVAPGSLDAATCVMALMNIDPLEPVAEGVSRLLKPGGALVAVMLHPAFRAPGQTSWGWDNAPRSEDEPMFPPRGERFRKPAPGRMRQYRRVDGYLSPGQTPITMNPGYAAHGAPPVTTWTFHRPLQTYVRALASAGLLIEAIEEWPSARRSQPGKTVAGRARAAEENRARREIPMFLALRAVKAAAPGAAGTIAAR